MWHEQIQTLCVLPLIFGQKTLGVLKLAQCQPSMAPIAVPPQAIAGTERNQLRGRWAAWRNRWG
ncbi:hypothetical protein [Serratia inhibens]